MKRFRSFSESNKYNEVTKLDYECGFALSRKFRPRTLRVIPFIILCLAETQRRLAIAIGLPILLSDHKRPLLLARISTLPIHAEPLFRENKPPEPTFYRCQYSGPIFRGSNSLDNSRENAAVRSAEDGSVQSPNTNLRTISWRVLKPSFSCNRAAAS